jgi:chaperone modulatory protein CbpM
MSRTPSAVVSGIVVEEHAVLTLDELCRFCTVREERIVALVEEGVLRPEGGRRSRWRFPESSLQRAAKALRLQRDLELDPPGVALVLELLDEIERLRGQLRARETGA